MLDGLAGVANSAGCDPFFQIRTAVADRARRNFYKVRPTATVPPVLESADRIAKDRRGFAFIYEGAGTWFILLHGCDLTSVALLDVRTRYVGDAP